MAGTIKTNAVQLGDSATDTQNFLLKTNVDGTMKLARKSDGSGGDILTVDAAGRVGLTSPPSVPAQSMVRLNTANGYGSTNTKIRRFTNVVTNQGTDITYTDSATLGASFTINTNGVYAISFSDQFTAAEWLGITLNTSAPTSAVYNIAPADIVACAYCPAISAPSVAASTLYLPSGAVIRPHNGLGVSGTNTNTCQFTITRVA